MSELIHKKSSKLVIFSVVFIDLLGFGVMIPMLPFFARHFGADAIKIGWLMFVYSFLQMLVSPIWGQLSDRFGRRPILLITIFGQVLAFLWAGFSVDYISLLASRVFAGIFSANISTASAYMADITKKEDRAKGMGLIGAAFGLGFILGPAIGGALISFGEEWPSLFSAFLATVNLVWAFLVLGEPVNVAERRSENRRKLDFSVYKRTLSQANFFVPILTFFLLTLAFVQLEITFGLFSLDKFHLRERDVGYIFAGMGVVMAIVQGGLIGQLVKRFGEKIVISMGMPLVILGLLGIIMSAQLSYMVLGILVLAVGYSLINPCLSATVSKAASAEQQGSVLGVYQSAGSLARVLGPALAGFLYTKSIVGAFWGAVAATMMAHVAFRLYLNLSRNSPGQN